MPNLLIIGFGESPQNGLGIRYSWHSKFPEKSLEMESDDVVILNLNEVYDEETIVRIINIIDFIEDNGGILVVVSAPPKMVSEKISNYHFLPWVKSLGKSIRYLNESEVRFHKEQPHWIKSFLFGLQNNLVSSVEFNPLPSTAHILMQGVGGTCISLVYQHRKGRLLIIPPTRQIMLNESNPSSRKMLSFYLKQIIENILPPFWNPSHERPSWLDSIFIRDEEKLRCQLHDIRNKLDEIEKEKSILADHGHSLSHKVTTILQSLGFHAEYKETKWLEDIEINDGDYKARIECTGKKGSLGKTKFRQVLEYLIDDREKIRGIFILNPWYHIHPNDRDLSKAYEDSVVKMAEQLKICLVTVPHLYKVFLSCKSEDDKLRIRESLKMCVGLWDYHVDNWRW